MLEMPRLPPVAPKAIVAFAQAVLALVVRRVEFLMKKLGSD